MCFLCLLVFQKKPKLSALEELFADEDMAVEVRQENILSTIEKVQDEMQRYKGLPSTLTSVNPVTWWWNMRDALPVLSKLATRYPCVQASSTPSERTFSTVGTPSARKGLVCVLRKQTCWFFWRKLLSDKVLCSNDRYILTCVCKCSFVLLLSYVRKLVWLEK